ncbi:MAG: mechanosensitive ion channel, partial [Paracoccus sp. (in: a-proteobacteria)]|nr:mechanosensitive ion channel [Paracoccus sp. (in: a-proteobacteria)]
FGRWTSPLLAALPLAAFVLFAGRWLSTNLFTDQVVVYDTLTIPPEKRPGVRRAGSLLAAFAAAYFLLSHSLLPLSGWSAAREDGAASDSVFSDAGAGVIYLLLMIPASVALFRVANILRRLVQFDGTDAPTFRARIMSLAGTLLRIVAIAGPVVLIVGMVNLANAVFWSAVLSLTLIAALVLLQDFVSDLYVMLLRGREGARNALTPMLVGLLLIIASLPLFALIWGASVTELGEWRERFMAGTQLGGITLSPTAILTFIIVFVIGFIATRWVQSAMRTVILPSTRLDEGAQSAAVSGLGYVGIFLAALFAITSAGIDLSALAIVAGALSVGIGFGLQNIVSNFVSGIILLIERPISTGDWIQAGSHMGTVSDISVRSTRIRTFDQTDVIVPNSDLISQPVVNWTRGNLRGRIIVPVSVAYRSDTRKVQQMLLEIAEDQPTVLIDPGPAVLLMGFGADGLNFEIRAILSDINGGMGVASEIRHQIVARFAEEGIEIPAAQRDIWLRNPEVLHDAAVASPPGGGPVDGASSTCTAQASGTSAPALLHKRPSAKDSGELAPSAEPDTGDGDGGDGSDGADSGGGVSDSPR